MNPSRFTIYNASAGSGKTFTLVKEYLKILLSKDNPYAFKNILAITFTNKAVAEMKTRVLESLMAFSKIEILKKENTMFQSLCDDLVMAPEKVHQKSKIVLETILHNYGAFDISTIDGFTHRIIRTFARDLKLSLNFEVELDSENLLSEAVDALISKAGVDQKITRVMIDFALEKLDDDRSWDISYDLNDIAKTLIKENNLVFLQALRDKSLDDFELLKKDLKKRISNLENKIKERASMAIQLIVSSGIDFSDFNGGSKSYLPNHLIKLSEGIFDVSFNTKWQENIDSSPLYPAGKSNSDAASKIDSIQPQLAQVFHETRNWINQLRFYVNFYRNITPLSVLNSINKEVEALQLENNTLLISEFNSIISQEIKNQPTPFIYERLGEKFKHYFIDEFQDTSLLQWENLKPLIANSLEQEQNEQQGSLMLVGDAKQAIYRWRGGEASQFIDLYNKKTKPFQVEQEVESLDSNFRSFDEIVNFNNRFFDFVSRTSFSNTDYGTLYGEAKQESKSLNEGYVQLEFLDINRDDDKELLYCEATLKTIQQCEVLNFRRGDICVLTRKNKESVAVSNYLMEHGIPVVSSDTLLLTNSKEVVFICNFLSLLVQPKNLIKKAEVLYFVAEKKGLEDIHDFLKENISKELSSLFYDLRTFEIELSFKNFFNDPLYETVESIVRAFHLVETSNAFVQFFMDEVLSFSQKHSNNIQEFLAYFEKKKDKLFVSNSENDQAVRVMTIHKAKGLEFPIVIFPFADLDIYAEIKPQVWYPLDQENFHGFPHTLLNFKQEMVDYGDIGNMIYRSQQAELELDNLNLLYVALTRPIEQLYVITKFEEKSSTKTYSGLFKEFLIQNNSWDNLKRTFPFGSPVKKKSLKKLEKSVIQTDVFISEPKNSHSIKVITKSGFLWDTVQANAIEKGNLIHSVLSKIKTLQDVSPALKTLVTDGDMDKNQAHEIEKTIDSILNHPTLKTYYDTENVVLNEQEIISKEGMLYRPDRIVFNESKSVTLLDYKTGAERPEHIQQLKTYESLLKEMGLNVEKKLLVYINQEITVKEF